MQKNVTYHSSAVLYNEMLEERAREAAEKVEHPVVKKWCISIANQHEFHANRHRRALAKLERKIARKKTITVEATEPATASASVPQPAPMEVKVDTDLDKEH